jgi:hypothetical protein
LLNEELKLIEKHRDFIIKSNEDISRLMGIREETLTKLNSRTENNVLAVLKILSSLYRRARDLAKLKNQQKLDLDRGTNDR